MSLRELAKRIAVSALGIPLALYLIWMGGWGLAMALALIAGLGAHEFFCLARAGGIKALPWIGIPGAVAMVVLAGANPSFSEAAPWSLGILFLVFFLAGISSIWLRWPDGNPLTAIPTTLVGVLYTGGTLTFAQYIRHLSPLNPAPGTDLAVHGLILLAFPLAATWAGDSAAYFFGHAWGNRKLLPAVSPGKTVVGGLAGLLTSTLVGLGLGITLLAFHASPAVSALVGAAMGGLLGIAAQLGDLVESVMKREAGVKDSGGLLPGHGGILDRFDALYFSLPLAYLMLILVEHLS